MSNKEIRAMMRNEKIYLWQVAKKLAIHETTLIKHFRSELSEDRQQRILTAIDEIKKERLHEE